MKLSTGRRWWMGAFAVALAIAAWPAEAAEARVAAEALGLQVAAGPSWPILPANLRAPSSPRLGSVQRLGWRAHPSRAQRRWLKLQQRRAALHRWRLAHLARQAGWRWAQARPARHLAWRLAHAPAWGRSLRNARAWPHSNQHLAWRLPGARVSGLARPALAAAGRWDLAEGALVVPMGSQRGPLAVQRLNERWSYIDLPGVRPAFRGLAWGQLPKEVGARWVMAARPGQHTTRVSLASAPGMAWRVEAGEGRLLLRPMPQAQAPAGLALGGAAPLTKVALAGVSPWVKREAAAVAAGAPGLASALASAPAPAGAREGAGAPAPVSTPAQVGALAGAARLSGQALAPAPAPAAPAAGAPGRAAEPSTPWLPSLRPQGVNPPRPQPQEGLASEGASSGLALPEAARLQGPAAKVAAGAAAPALASAQGPSAGQEALPAAGQGDAVARAEDEGDTRMELAERTPDGHLAIRYQGRVPTVQWQRRGHLRNSLRFSASSLREGQAQRVAPLHHPTLQDGVVRQLGSEVEVDLTLTQEGRVGVYVDRSQRRLVLIMDGAPAPVAPSRGPSAVEALPPPPPEEGSGAPPS